MRRANIAYRSPELARYYAANRNSWSALYPSERWVFSRLAGASRRLGHVLDVGCACGGLGRALAGRFRVSSYTGVEINREAVEAGRLARFPVPARLVAGDILKVRLGRRYDLVTSLSCADWNLRTADIVAACWRLVRPGGSFVISLRLTPGRGVNDIRRSWQAIDFSGATRGPERANYVVFGVREALAMLAGLRPESLGAYGYWGRPSATARTPFRELVFAVFWARRPEGRPPERPAAELHLPSDMFMGA